MGQRIMSKEKGLYQNYVEKGANGKWAQDIERDIYRTFPTHPYFSTQGDMLGERGQKALGNILRSYSELNPEVGYC